MARTTRYEYQISRDLERYDFYALLMAAMRRADTTNSRALQAAFPEVWAELEERYDTPGGWLSAEPGFEAAMLDAGRTDKIPGHPDELAARRHAPR